MGLLKNIFSSHTSRELRRSVSPSIRIYAVFHASPSSDSLSGDPLYFAASHAEAVSFIHRQIQLNHADHYASWCRLHGFEPGFPSNSWDDYVSQVLASSSDCPPDDSFAIAVLPFSKANVASFIRILSQTQPALLPGESDEEIMTYAASCPDETKKLSKVIAKVDAEAAKRIDNITREM